MPIRSDGEETKRKVLNAAGRFFALKGFASTTNRDISSHAKVNSASISYYFRDKSGLYREAWAHCQKKSAAKYVDWIESSIPPAGSDLQTIMDFLRSLCNNLFSWMFDKRAYDSEIWRREMTAPTGELESPELDMVALPLKQAIKDCIIRVLGEEHEITATIITHNISASYVACFQKDSVEFRQDDTQTLFDNMFGVTLNSVLAAVMDAPPVQAPKPKQPRQPKPKQQTKKVKESKLQEKKAKPAPKKPGRKKQDPPASSQLSLFDW